MPIRSSIFQTRQTEILNLASLIESRTKARPDTIKYFLEPFRGVLLSAVAPANHFIFGRRGSGKTSLLLKAAHELSAKGRPVAFANAERMRSQERNHVILTILLISFQGIQAWLQADSIEKLRKAGERGDFDFLQFLNLFASKNRQAEAELLKYLEPIIRALRILCGHDIAKSADLRDLSQEAPLAAVLKEVLGRKKQAMNEKRKEITQEHVDLFGQLFADIGATVGQPVYLLIDDLYRLQRDDQPYVVDFFLSLSAARAVHLKIGTVKNRTRWFIFDGKNRIGAQVGNDFTEVNLDSSLEAYATTKDHLGKILGSCLIERGFILDELANPMVKERLAQASGGVARDFLNLFCVSIRKTIERTGSPAQEGSTKMVAKDVYAAVSDYTDIRRQEFKSELDEQDQERLLELSKRITSFCLSNKSNVFLVKKLSDGQLPHDVLGLMDLKGCHLVRGAVHLTGQAGPFAAFMLDISYSAPFKDTQKLTLIKLDDPELGAKIADQKYIFTLT